MSSEKTTVFICDDSPLIRRGLTAAIEQFDNFSILGTAANGVTALEHIARLIPHAVLMDVFMPDMNGIELTHRLKEQFPAIKVLMLTAASDDQTIFAALAAGAHGYCLKESPIENILHALATIANGAGWLDPAIAMRVLRNAAREGTISSQNIPKLGRRDDRFRLSQREIEVLSLLVEGCPNKEIGVRLCISVETVKTHMRHIMEKLQVADRTQAATKALRQGLLMPELQEV